MYLINKSVINILIELILYIYDHHINLQHTSRGILCFERLILS